MMQLMEVLLVLVLVVVVAIVLVVVVIIVVIFVPTVVVVSSIAARVASATGCSVLAHTRLFTFEFVVSTVSFFFQQLRTIDFDKPPKENDKNTDRSVLL